MDGEDTHPSILTLNFTADPNCTGFEMGTIANWYFDKVCLEAPEFIVEMRARNYACPLRDVSELTDLFFGDLRLDAMFLLLLQFILQLLLLQQGSIPVPMGDESSTLNLIIGWFAWLLFTGFTVGQVKIATRLCFMRRAVASRIAVRYQHSYPIPLCLGAFLRP